MKWILHNCIIFNGGNILLNCINKIVQFILFRAVLQYMELILRWLNNFVVGGKLTAAAKLIVKIAKHETSEVEICPECYLNSYLKKNNNWFCEPCVSTKLLHSCFPPFQEFRIVDESPYKLKPSTTFTICIWIGLCLLFRNLHTRLFGPN